MTTASETPQTQTNTHVSERARNWLSALYRDLGQTHLREGRLERAQGLFDKEAALKIPAKVRLTTHR